MTEAAANPHVDWSQDPILNDTPPKSPLMKKSELGNLSPRKSPSPRNSFPPPFFAQDDNYYDASPKDQIYPGDGFLIHHMDNGRNAALAQNATVRPLPPIRPPSNECERDPLFPPDSAQQPTLNGHPKPKEPPANPRSLEHLAANALQHVHFGDRLNYDPFTKDISASTYQLSIQDKSNELANPPINDLFKFRKENIRTDNLSPPPVLTPDSAGLPPISDSAGLPPISDNAGLPPISPRTSEYNSQTLPSIRSTFAGIDLSPKEQPSVTQNGPRSGSAPGLSPSLNLHQLPPLTGNHGTAPISPPDSYQASPQAPPVTNSFLPRSQGRPQHKTPDEEAIEEHKKRKATSTISIPVPPAAIPHRGTASESSNNSSTSYVCNYAGCKAPPFQTQYLLNSHANVHSSARPHYCPVQGCPRSEGGKGFKRKNEMIRHGLVHDSPGYVCPFCPDRDHRYPRPDNLQRHVRVHHSDKNKDDPQLRNVLAQRADGPNRGRRRRTGMHIAGEI